MRASTVVSLIAMCAGVAPARAQQGSRPGHGAEAGGAPATPVRMWQDTITIPTYLLGPPDPDPIFYTGEVYQGAQRHVYPYPAQDALTNRRAPRRYVALHLENAYLSVTVLPQLGGKVFEARDRTDGYDFIYHQHVIKPARIGMLGAWTSGGIEWDVFHHHRATAFMPVEYALESNPDGSRTIWVGEQERRQRMRWMVGLTLRPGRSYLEASVRMVNRTAMPQTMLYWANAAVPVDSLYQVFFPPSVRVVTFHRKVVFSTWPVGSGTYAGGVDERGVDQSWWKSQPSPTSFFAWDLHDGFFGGYDHGRHAGVVHIGDPRVMIGAKEWEWGPGPAGHLWDSEILTDSDGPYAELMAGAYSNNQPDYSWFEPYDVRAFKEYWYPVRGIGGFTDADLDGAMNLVVRGDTAALGFNVTSPRRGAHAVLRVGRRTVLDSAIAIDPAHPFRTRVGLPAGTAPADVEGELRAADGTVLLRYRPSPPSAPPPLPSPVRPPPPPAEVASADSLYALGQRAEQINSPNVDPDAYYDEALRRDPGDARVNLRVGERLSRRWKYAEAEAHIVRALARLGPGYTTPESGEAEYQLGMALRGQGKVDSARYAFGRATWDPRYRGAAFHQLAELSLAAGRFTAALNETRRAEAASPERELAPGLEAAALRHLGRPAAAERVAGAAAAADAFGFLARNEVVLARRAEGNAAGARAELADLDRRMRGDVESYLDLATDYEDAGLWAEAAGVLERAAGQPGPSGRPYPMVSYHLAYAYGRLDRPAEAARAAARAAALPTPYCFPFRRESVDVLRAAVRRDPRDAHAWYYLGDLLYDRQPRAAITAWETARRLEPGFAMVLRNLGWAYRWTDHDLSRAIAAYKAARAADPTDGRMALELDQAYELANTPLAVRLAALRESPAALAGNSDDLAREAIVLTASGRYDDALSVLDHTRFHVQEMAGAVHDAFVDAHLLRGLARLGSHDAAGALADFAAAGTYPANLAVGRPYHDARAPQIAYFTALAREALGDSAAEHELLDAAAGQAGTQGSPETRYYQAMALRRLGRDSAAAAVFRGVVAAGRAAVAHATTPAESARPDAAAREAAARRVLALGLLGLGDRTAALRELERAHALRVADPWVAYYLASSREGAR